MASDPLATSTRMRTVLFEDIMLGMYLVPARDGRGALIDHLQKNADGSEREAERKGLKPGFLLVRIDDIQVDEKDFEKIIDLVRSRGRPLKAVFADPDKDEYR